MLPQVIAMIRGEYHNCVIPKFFRLQLVKNQPDLRIHERHAGMIGLRVFTSKRIILPAQLKPKAAEPLDHRHLRNIGPIVGRTQLKLKFAPRIEVEIFLRRDERNVRFVDANRDKERLVAVAFFVDPLDDFAGVPAIPMLRVVQPAWPVAGARLAARLGEHLRQLLLP